MAEGHTKNANGKKSEGVTTGMAHEEIRQAYQMLGQEATAYDGMITCSTLFGRTICKLVWDMNKADNDRYLQLALAGIREDFAGKLLEVPVGTGVLTMLPGAEARRHFLRLFLYPGRNPAHRLVYPAFLRTEGLFYSSV